MPREARNCQNLAEGLLDQRAYALAMELETAASTIEVTDTGVLIRWSDGARSRFHSLWLRHNCPLASSGTQASLTELNPDVFVMFAERNDDGDLAVEFSNGHETAFDFEWLQAHSHEPHELVPAVTAESFRAGHQFAELALPVGGSAEHERMLDLLGQWGAVIVTDVSPCAIDEVAELVGPMRATETDPIIDLYIDADLDGPSESATSAGNVGLVGDPRTIDAFRSEPSGIVIITCEEQADSGGEFALVDGFAIATDLQDDDPDSFDQLSQTTVRFRSTATPTLTTRASMIDVDAHYRVARVRFDEHSLAPLDIEPRQIDDYYRAIITVTKQVNDPGRAVQVTLQPGQALVIDNRRVLTGQAAVGLDGHQHHQLCSIDADWFEQRCRQLQVASAKLDAAERHQDDRSLFT